jgi:hypothetical protein
VGISLRFQNNNHDVAYVSLFGIVGELLKRA